MKMARPHVVVPPKRLGRPSLDNSGSVAADVHLTLPAAEYDDAFHVARKNRESIQALIRRALKRLLEDERGGSL